jgi:radical SAM protein with 4Fe4S-binding SPASM domain
MIKSLVKPANLLIAGYSYLISSVSGKASMKGMPVSLSVELTNNCNLQCPQCISGSGMMGRKHGFMDIKLFNKIINELNPFLYNLNLYFQGEPMLHPSFFAFVKNSRGIHTVVSTNGHFLSEENSEKIIYSGLHKLIISLDGVDQEIYAGYRVNGNLETVIAGIKNVTDSKKRHNSSLKIVLQFLVNRINEKQIPKVKKMAKKLNASLSLKSMQIIDKADIGSWLPGNSRYNRYRLKDGVYIIKGSLPDRCARQWFNPVITWDGKVVPCCFDKDAEHVMGDLNHNSFREIWEGPKYRIFRKSILSGRQMIEMCRNCTSGLKGVKY